MRHQVPQSWWGRPGGKAEAPRHGADTESHSAGWAHLGERGRLRTRGQVLEHGPEEEGGLPAGGESGPPVVPGLLFCLIIVF